MSETDAITQILIANEGPDIRRLHPRHGVWALARPGLFARARRSRSARVEECRAALFGAVLSSDPAVFVRHPESPEEYEVRGPWDLRADKTWSVPAGFSREERASASWLAVGGWVLYAGPHPVDAAWPDLFHLPPDASSSWIRSQGVRAAISSFYDDDEWRVVV